METITLLVVEDNPGDARLIEEYLKMDTSATYSISFTTTLADCLNTLSNKKFDVVLVDLGLPDSQGIYTFHKIISASPNSPIVIITGTDNENIGIEAIRNGAQNYLVKNQINSTLLIRTIRFAIEVKRKNVELKKSREKYCSIFEGAASLILSINLEGKITDCNNRIQEILGYNKAEVTGQAVKMIIHPDSYEKAEKSIHEVFEKGILCTGEYKMIRKDGKTIFVNIHSSALKDEDNKNIVASCIIDDITERKYYEKRQQLTTKILSILNRKNEWQKIVYDILQEIKEFSGIEAVGIRHLDGEDYPYFSSIGFSDSFIRKENFLCARNKRGELLYDSNGNIILECMCGNIISKRTNPSLSFFTKAGSFWTNSTTNLLATTTDKERQAHTRNHCNVAGYESVALIPLVSENKTIGLLQLNDKRKNVFTEDTIHFFEEIGLTIGIAFKRLKSEKAISDSEVRYRRLFESAKDGILILDALNGQIVDVNPFITEMLGYSHQELLGKELWKIVALKNVVASKNAFIELQSKEYIRFENIPLESKDGKHINVEFISNVYLVDHTKVIQCNIRDITERLLAHEQLLIAKGKAEESDHLKTAFLHNISHEIRTPMNAIVGFSEFLNDPDLLPEKRKHFTDIIIQSCDQLLAIITDIISIATIESGQEKIQDNEININLICKLLNDQFFSKFPNKNVTLSMKNILADDEAIIITDASKLTQILTNLIGNALKFTQQGYVNFGYTAKDSQLEFYVEDTGIGIPLDMQDVIFNHFRQVETSATRQFGGSGLGLSISKAYVEMLGGKMWLTSELNKGSVFYFTIPYKKVNTKGLPDVPSIKGLRFEFKTPKTLLIAEDEDSNFMLLEELLSGKGINIIRAVNGIEAVELCKNNPQIDLVLMDIKMPELDGYEATIQIKEFKPDLYIIAQTAYSTEVDKNRAFACGCSDFMSKPIKKELLLSKISEQLLK